MFNNRPKLNFGSNNLNSNVDNDGKIGLRAELESKSRSNGQKAGRPPPSPPNSRNIVPSSQYLKQLALNNLDYKVPMDYKPMFKVQSSTKSCYTGPQSISGHNKLPTAVPVASTSEDCESRLKKLEKSGLLAKFSRFNITKSIPLANEEDDPDEAENDIENVQGFIDLSQSSPETIEIKSSPEFEPRFVTQIREECRKISSQSFGSQSQSQSQRTRVNNTSVGRTPRKNTPRKSSPRKRKSSAKSQAMGKYQQKLPIFLETSVSPPKESRVVARRSKSNDNINHESQRGVSNKPVMSRSSSHLPDVAKRSRPSDARLSTSLAVDKHNDSRANNSRNDSFGRKSQSRADQQQNSINNSRQEPKRTSNSSLNSSRDKTIRKIKVNQKYYQILNCIGQGGSSKVYQVYDSELQMTLAIKVVDLSRADAETVKGYKNEITLLSKLRQCKRVVRMYDYEYQNNGKQLLVVMEKGDSDLSNVLKSFIEAEEKRSLDSHLIRFYWLQMLKAVDEIHSYGVVHSDLKPVNFILVAGKLKLIDFGIANAIQANLTSVVKESQIGTINYMAPEALQNRSLVKGKTVIKYNCKADIWSLGCILYNLVYGRTPFHEYNDLFAKAYAIMNTNHQIEFPPIADHLLLDVMKKCLRRDPNKRPTTGELLNHSYLTEAKPHKGGTGGTALASQTQLISQINNLTPNSIKQLSQVIEKLAKK